MNVMVKLKNRDSLKETLSYGISDDFELRKRTKRIIIFFLLTPFWSGFLMIIAVRFLAKNDRNNERGF